MQLEPKRGKAMDRRQRFHEDIRSKHINTYMQKVRKMFFYKTKEDYDLLHNIKLDKVLQTFKSEDKPESVQLQQAINSMFLYATSDNSSHLFSLFDQGILEKLCDLYGFNSENQSSQINYLTRKIFFILTNYAGYGTDLPDHFMTLLKLIWNTKDQNQKLLVLRSIESLIYHNPDGDQKYNRVFKQQESQFFNHVLMSIETQITETTVEVQKYTQIAYLVSIATSASKDPNIPIPQQFYIALSKLFDLKNPKQSMYSDKLLSYVLKNLYQIVLELDSQGKFKEVIKLKKLSGALNKWLVNQIEGFKQGNKCKEQFIVIGLKIMKAMMQLDYPRQGDADFNSYEAQILDQMVSNIFDSCIKKGAHVIIQHCNKKVKQLLFELLEGFCWHATFCEQILLHHLYIPAALLYHIKHAEFRLKKCSLKCISAMMESAFCEGGDLKQMMIECTKDGKIVELLAQNLNSYVDVEVNIAIVQILTILADNEHRKFMDSQQQSTLPIGQIVSRNYILAGFEQAGGYEQLGKIINEHKNQQLRTQAMAFAEKYKINLEDGDL